MPYMLLFHICPSTFCQADRICSEQESGMQLNSRTALKAVNPRDSRDTLGIYIAFRMLQSSEFVPSCTESLP